MILQKSSSAKINSIKASLKSTETLLIMPHLDGDIFPLQGHRTFQWHKSAGHSHKTSKLEKLILNISRIKRERPHPFGQIPFRNAVHQCSFISTTRLQFALYRVRFLCQHLKLTSEKMDDYLSTLFTFRCITLCFYSSLSAVELPELPLEV